MSTAQASSADCQGFSSIVSADKIENSPSAFRKLDSLHTIGSLGWIILTTSLPLLRFIAAVRLQQTRDNRVTEFPPLSAHGHQLNRRL